MAAPVNIHLGGSDATNGSDGIKASEARAGKAPLADMSTIGQDQITIVNSEKRKPNEAVAYMQSSAKKQLIGSIVAFTGSVLAAPALSAAIVGVSVSPLGLAAAVVGGAMIAGGLLTKIWGKVNSLQAMFAKNE